MAGSDETRRLGRPGHDTEDAPEADPDESFEQLLRAAAGAGMRPAAARRILAGQLDPVRTGMVLSDKYRIEREIGSGAMGAVFEATHLVTGKRVAVKILIGHGATTRERFIREAQAAGRIEHPNIVDIYDVGEDGPHIYLVMELLVGESLRARMARGPMTGPEAVSLLMPALRGVAAAHAQGVVHRDLKPDNIFLCDRGADVAPEAKVLDFGISKLQHTLELERNGDLTPNLLHEQASLHDDLTHSDAVVGTPRYMAPEQARGSKHVDHRADVYALGLLLYEMISRRRPFTARSYSDLIEQIASAAPVSLRTLVPDIAQPLEQVVMRALANAPEDRHQSVEELARALEPFGHVGYVAGLRMSLLRLQSPASLPAPAARASLRRGMLLWTALGLLSLAGVGWAVKRFAFGATVAEQAGAPASAPQRGVQPAPARIASPPPQPVALPESPSPEPSATPAQRLVVKRKRVPAKPATAPSTALPSGAASAVPDPWGPELSGSRKRTAKATRSASGSLGSTDF